LDELKEIPVIMKPLPTKHVLAIDLDVIPYIPLVVENCWKISIEFNGLTGLTIAQETAPDLVLIGSNLVDIDCFELLRLLKSHPSTMYIPTFIVINGFRELNQIIGTSKLKHTETRLRKR
jgi:response regulator RpfG family c-di-GMP phosphodiesterase